MTIFTPELETQLKSCVRIAQRLGGGLLAFDPAKLPAGGTEITGLRDYSTGDEPWRIDWGVCARHDELRVRVYGGNAQRNAYLLLDTSYGMCFRPSKLLAAKQAAAVLAYGLLATGALLEFGTFMPDFALYPVLSHEQKTGRFLRFLEEMELSQDPNITDFAFLARSFVEQKRPAGEVFVLSDFFGESDSFEKDFKAGFELLQQAGYDVRAVHLEDPTERAEGLVGDVDIYDPSRDYRQIITLTEHDLAVYQRLYDEYLASVKAFFEKHEIPSTRVQVTEDVSALCLAALGLPENAAEVNPWEEFLAEKS